MLQKLYAFINVLIIVIGKMVNNLSMLWINHVDSVLGELSLMHKLRLDPINVDEAKVLVEMKVDKFLLKLISLDDNKKVDYT